MSIQRRLKHALTVQERKSVANAGLNVKRLTGEDIKPEHWEAFYLAYINTTGAFVTSNLLCLPS